MNSLKVLVMLYELILQADENELKILLAYAQNLMESKKEV